MIGRFVRSRQPFVCLDFGRDQLTALEVAGGAVTRWSARPLPEGTLRSGDPVLTSFVADVVRQALARDGIQARHVRIALPDEASVSRQVTLPPMPRRELVRAVRFAAEKNLPFPIDRARWAWDVVDRRRDGVTVYLVATWQDVVERYAEVARTANLEPQVLEPRAVAVARALNQERALVLDASQRRLHAMLLVTGQPAYLDEVLVSQVVDDEREALDRLLQRAYRHQSTLGATPGRLAPVLLAGQLEEAELELPVSGKPVGDVLNGHLPSAPRGFRPGAYLANLGLSMRGTK